MALSFFHGGQLVRGAQVGEQERPTVTSRILSDDDQSNTLRLRPQALRKLHSETALRESARADENLPKSRPSSRPYTSSRTEKGKEVLRPTSNQSKGRPVTASSFQSDASSIAPAESSKARALRVLGVKKPSFLNLRSPSTLKPADQPRPKSSGTERKSWKEKVAFIREQPAATRQDAPTLTFRSTAKNTTTQGANPGQRISDAAAEMRAAMDTTRQAPSRLLMPPKKTIDSAQFLAECLAHVIVGEWLYKDPHKPGLMPQANVLQRHLGPPPRGSTGVPQRRWFRVDPYERQLSWSSKWDSAASAQHKMSRRVPIKLVFEVSNRLVLDGCIPPHAMPHDRSIVVVAPQKVLKITAPDSIRHSLWLTGLQYLVDSTKKVNNADWPDVLAARLASLNPLLDANNERPVPVKLPVTVPSGDTALKSPFFITEKPLPPSPPRLETASTMMMMTPPVVPRFSHHAQQPSEGVSSSVAESEGFVAEAAATSKRSESFKSKHVEPYTPSDQKHTPNTHTEEDPAPADDPSDELAVDQMEMLVDRLADI